ncbi:hemerythrin domain-containing protein [Desulfosporosinus hippei]|uniref:Hemerythrin HHE cation binding domain-containing protein n=1 Tax=Desulfosporosinus hippei DSM 8344 TaxID=1121419 RepID=A0A1G7VT74_9FIRM|nr:hemerythrin domain-containing protein [Desulfosporosinus hippei]SDG62100.1 Hemerythrin HHE cation binding domain-containing protein [Desulfosporosinus hippei DSM 8344]
MNINNLKRQHQEIRQLVDDIESLLNQDVMAKAFDISLKIATLAGKLSFHLKSEDDFLYPSLIISKDEDLKKISLSFNQEMGHIAQSFSDYKTKYMSSTRIKEACTQFIADTRSIILELRNRLNKEDKKLYPIVEQF